MRNHDVLTRIIYQDISD